MFRVMTIDSPSKVSVTDEQAFVCPPPVGSLRWIDLLEQDSASLAVLTEQFGFHPLTIEDCLHFDQRPKLESYDEYMFLVIQGFHVDWEDLDRSDAVELHLFVGDDYIVTVHDQPIPAMEIVWNRIARQRRATANHADYLCYLIADGVIDSYFPVLDELQLRMDSLEDRVLDPDQNVNLAEIFEFKRLLIDLRKILSPQRDVLAILAKRDGKFISEHVSIFFRDVYDHALRLHESVESARDLVGNVRDAHMWNASQRTNEIMKRLTILSAIFLPLTFITGFFGQNFESLPFSSRTLMYGMVLTCIAVPVGMLSYFVRSKWF